jgi:integrase
MKLTDKVVRTLTPTAKHSFIVYDSGHSDAIAGFGIRVTRRGVKSWIFNFRARLIGIERRLTIGSASAWSAEQAREEAKGLRRIVEQGGDPLQERQDERDEPDCNQLFDRYEAEHAPRKRSAASDTMMLRQWLRPELGRMKVRDVTFADIDRLHRRITDHRTPIRANRTLALASKCFSLAIRWQWRETNPCRGVERNHEDPRERFLSAEELERFIAALNVSKHPSRNIVKLALLTGARRGEILSMRWRHVDVAVGVWTKPSSHTKSKKNHRVPLSAPARQLLSEMRAEAASAAKAQGRDIPEYVFPSPNGSGAQRELAKFWARLCRDADLRDFRLHDVRHEAASLMASGGASLPLIGAILGHASPATTARYAHLADEAQRAVVERVAAAIDAAGVSSRDIVNLQKRKA